ncbi:MAG: SGNH/GDSL hydrolase family protein [Verrucomicrobiales bacterium]|nr:SGNH/GDSL hydrolase family protein [Verrucomicrobiales bacterium]
MSLCPRCHSIARGGILLAPVLAILMVAQEAAPADRNPVNTRFIPGDMLADSPVEFPERGALPARFPPDVPIAHEPAEPDYYLFASPCRSVAQIRRIQSEMPAGRFVPPRPDWTHLPRTRRVLIEGGDLHLLALGDSIVNDTMRSGWVGLLQDAHPEARIRATVYVRGGGGCQHYREAERIAKNVVPRRPDLVFIGGISQRSLEDIREVIQQLRAGLPDVEILLATGAFGTADPRDPEALAKAPHSGAGAYGVALRRLADAERCGFLDLTTPWAEYIVSSGLHPHRFYRDVVHANEFGEQILARILMAFFKTHGFQIEETDERIVLRGEAIEAAVRKTGYVSGVEGGSFHDRQTGARDLGFGLDIQDWIMEPGSDAAYRDRLPGDLPYDYHNLYHGRRAKRSIEGPQICTQARRLEPRIIEGADFVAIEQNWTYRLAAPGKNTGSEWSQTLVFPSGRRYFVSSDWILSRNAGEALFFRQDMPGHIKHRHGDTFSEVYLSYAGRIPSSAFVEDFAPDERFNYRRDRDGVPERMIRAYRIRDPLAGKEGPWLAGMTLDPAATSEAWCHQRGYVCLIHEVGERPVREGESFGAAYVVGYFDSIPEMERVYDRYRGSTALEVTAAGWQLVGAASP